MERSGPISEKAATLKTHYCTIGEEHSFKKVTGRSLVVVRRKIVAWQDR